MNNRYLRRVQMGIKYNIRISSRSFLQYDLMPCYIKHSPVLECVIYGMLLFGFRGFRVFNIAV